MNRFKQPKVSSSPDIVTPQQTPNYDTFEPRFSFSFLQNGYRIKDLPKDAKAALADTIETLSCLTWREIKSQCRHKLGFEIIHALDASLPEKFQGSNPIAFRFCDMRPMIGVRVKSVFYVLWLDYRMELYKH